MVIKAFRYQISPWEWEHFTLNKNVIRNNILRDLLLDINLETPQTVILSERMIKIDNIDYYEVTMNLVTGDTR